jgi:hypothetical protein
MKFIINYTNCAQDIFFDKIKNYFDFSKIEKSYPEFVTDHLRKYSYQLEDFKIEFIKFADETTLSIYMKKDQIACTTLEHFKCLHSDIHKVWDKSFENLYTFHIETINNIINHYISFLVLNKDKIEILKSDAYYDSSHII